MSAPAVGVFPSLGRGSDELRSLLARIEDAGFDHVCCGDHVSFFVGIGTDGLLSATAYATAHPRLPVYTAVYLLPLRHPVLVARQLADFAAFAPGRLVFGVGVGGEDPHEVAICGVDPRTCGRRMDECLEIVRRLLTGEPVTFHGEFFDLDDAVVLPAAAEPIPIVIGGRSEAAVRRAGRLGDGWLGIWNSPRRFAEVVEQIDEEAARAGRDDHPRRHGMQVWCGLGGSHEEARAARAPAMQAMYQIPFERFEKYSPAGTPEDVAAFLAPYVEAGCTSFNLIPQARDPQAALEGAAEVKRLLARVRNDTVVVARRFCGPADSGNGGYTCGMIARHVGNPAEVTLRQPPPLDRPLAVQRADDEVGMYDGDTLIAEARPVETVAVDVPEPVSFADAGVASADSWIATRPEGHPFPTCFVCGPGRAVGDGLRVFVGPVREREGLYAAPWVPDASLQAPADEEHVAPEFVWATLDCSGGIGGLYDAFEVGVPHMLGRLTVEVLAPVAVGEHCVALGWHLGAEGRKVETASALLGGDGGLVGRARATWIRLQ